MLQSSVCFFNRFATILFTSSLLLSCKNHASEQNQSEAKFTYSTYTRDEIIETTINYTLRYHSDPIAFASKSVGTPKAVLLTLLAMERNNDWKHTGTLSGYSIGDMATRSLGRRSSLGPANVSLGALDYVKQQRPEQFKKISAEDAYQSILLSETNGVRWGAQYLQVIYDDIVSKEKLDATKKWVKAIGLYNEGIGNSSAYVFGPYSELIEATFVEAKKYYIMK